MTGARLTATTCRAKVLYARETIVITHEMEVRKPYPNQCQYHAVAISKSLTSTAVTEQKRPTVPFSYLNTWYTCDTVVARYEVLPGSTDALPLPVIGMVSTKAVPAPANNSYNHWLRIVYDGYDNPTYISNLESQGVDWATV